MAVSSGGLTLLPCKPGVCQMCAVLHNADEPHNAQSLYYGVRFRMQHGRDATWEDAVAHCSDRTKEQWRKGVVKMGAEWTRPPEGVQPIAEKVTFNP